MIDLDLFFQYLKDVAMATNFMKKNGKLVSFVAATFLNGMGYLYLNVRINSANYASKSCKNFVNFGPVTPELTEFISERLVRHGRKNWRI